MPLPLRPGDDVFVEEEMGEVKVESNHDMDYGQGENVLEVLEGEVKNEDETLRAHA